MAATFHHFGVPTSIQQENEEFLEGGKVHYTDPEAHPYRVEFLRFEADSPMPQELQTRNHAAFVVDDLAAAIAGQKVVMDPTPINENLRIAFIMDGDALIEVMEMT